MALRSRGIESVPTETARIARAAFPKGTLCMRLRDELGPIFQDPMFAALYAQTGQPALSPWRLALISVLQFVEGLSDRQASAAVRSRIDWKYALALELTDPGFDFSVLCEFRARLIKNKGEFLLFEVVVQRLIECGLLKPHGRYRTDSTHVLAAVRTINRLEGAGESKRGPTAACRFGAFGSRVGVRHRRWWTPGLAWWGRLHGLEFGPAGMER